MQARTVPPFDAYDYEKGNEPFVFASYAHKDSHEVYPDLMRLHQEGFRIWYDEGIDPGNEWPEDVAKALQRSEYFFVFVSPQAVDSENVRNEINYALKHKKRFLAVHLTETVLPPGMDLQMGSRQAILKFQMDQDRYWRILQRTLPSSLRRKRNSGESGFDASVRAPGKPAEEVIAIPGSKAVIEMVWIPPGTFMMGSPESDQEARESELRQHEVRITEGYWLGKYPVTQAQWQAIMGTFPSQFKGKERPVETVTYDDCADFLGELTLKGGGFFRLPTEAEWEYACRAGTTTRYSFGDNEKDLSRYAWFAGNASGQTASAGKLQPNPWGLYDMHGNVWEWCQDWYGEHYAGGSVTDPSGPSSGKYRVLRGGSCVYRPGDCRCASRGYDTPDHVSMDRGLRVVRTS